MSDVPIIIFSDPGIDDWLAISLTMLSRKFKIIGACGVSGNVSSEIAAASLSRLFGLYGLDVPIYKGTVITEFNFPSPLELIHGKNGLRDIDVPYKNGLYHTVKNFDEICNIFLECYNNIIVISLGPLTDIANILEHYPEAKSKISCLIMMGGGFSTGNITKSAEFNIYCNPKAANCVFRSGINIKLIPIHITRQVRLYPSDIQPLVQSDDLKPNIIGRMLEFSFKFHKELSGFEVAMYMIL